MNKETNDRSQSKKVVYATDVKGKKFTNGKKTKDKVAKLMRDATNHFAWYNKFPKLIEDAARLSFNNPIGQEVETLDTNSQDPILQTYYGKVSIPGIMKLTCIPTIGTSVDGNSDVNNAMRLIYAWVRHANSGSRNYEAADYMTYLMAMRSIYDYHAEMSRLYGICMTYSNVNRYIARGLITALGYDYDNIVKHLPSLRYYINQFAIKANTFAVPKEMDYYQRGYLIPSKVYKDSDDDKCGLYVLQYLGYFKWDAITEGGSALYLDMPMLASQGTPLTIDNIISFGDSLMNALMTNEDIGIMSGDTLKAYGNDNLYHLKGISDDYFCVPEYDKMMLYQIHNTQFYPMLFMSMDPLITGTVPYVSQLNGNLISSITALSPEAFWEASGENASWPIEKLRRIQEALVNTNPLLDVDVDNPSTEIVTEATRNMISYEKVRVDGYDTIRVSSCGTELFISAHIYKLAEDGSATPAASEGVDIESGFFLDELVTPSSDVFVKLVLFPYFDWAPKIPVYWDFGDSDRIVCYPFGELFNYTPIHKDALKKLHNACLLSLFNVKGIGITI